MLSLPAPLIDERTAEGTMRPIGHLPAVPFDSDSRRALCGAEIAGIRAFGGFDRCIVCDELWDIYFPEIPRA